MPEPVNGATLRSMDSTLVGRLLLAVGVLIALAGAWMATGHKMPFGSLPGDISGGGGNFSFSFPIVSCILLSVVLTIILNIVIRR